MQSPFIFLVLPEVMKGCLGNCSLTTQVFVDLAYKHVESISIRILDSVK